MASIAPVIAFVFRPNGVAAGNVYTTWPSLMAALATVEGRKLLEFDDSASVLADGRNGCEIPPGTYNMRDVVWAGFAPRTGFPRTRVVIVEGTVFQQLRMIGGQITIENRATATPPIADFGPGGGEANHVQIGLRDDCGNTQLLNPGTAPLFDCGPYRVMMFAQNTFLGIDTAGQAQLHPLIRQRQGGNLTINFIGQNQTGEDVVDSPPGALMRFGALSSSTQIAFKQDAILSANEFAPVTKVQRKVRPRPPLPPATSSQPMDKPNELIRCDGRGAGFTQVLPGIKSGFSVRTMPRFIPMYTGGSEVVVCEVAGGNKLEVAPSAGDTIDGSPDPVRFKAHESRIFASDGESNWITIAGFRS